MWSANKFTRMMFIVPVIFIFFAFFLHALQVPHLHVASIDVSHSHNRDHSPAMPEGVSGIPDYLHQSDKKDLLTLLLALGALAGIAYVAWPAAKAFIQVFVTFFFKLATRKKLFVTYLNILFALGIINPKLH
jgi:hypothetical protein